MPAAKFKEQCLALLTRSTPRGSSSPSGGRPVAKLIPSVRIPSRCSAVSKGSSGSKGTSCRQGWPGMLNLDTHILLHGLAGSLTAREAALAARALEHLGHRAVGGRKARRARPYRRRPRQPRADEGSRPPADLAARPLGLAGLSASSTSLVIPQTRSSLPRASSTTFLVVTRSRSQALEMFRSRGEAGRARACRNHG